MKKSLHLLPVHQRKMSKSEMNLHQTKMSKLEMNLHQMKMSKFNLNLHLRKMPKLRQMMSNWLIKFLSVVGTSVIYKKAREIGQKKTLGNKTFLTPVPYAITLKANGVNTSIENAQNIAAKRRVGKRNQEVKRASI